MIVFTCPECGYELREWMIATYPPIHVVDCQNCGYYHEKRDTITAVPYTAETTNLTVAHHTYGEN